MSQDIVLDTSCFHSLLKDGELLQHFTKTVRSRPIRIVAPAHVLDELIGGDVPDRIVDRAKLVARLWTTLGHCKFTVSRSMHKIMLEELEHEISSTPTMSALTRRRILQALSNMDPTSTRTIETITACNEIRDDKDRALSLDRASRAKSKEAGLFDTRGARSEAVQFFATYAGPTDEFDWFLDAFLRNEPPGADRLMVAMHRVRSEPRFKTVRAFLSLAQLTMYGGTLTGYSDDPSIKCFAVRVNNWFDNVITASAAHADTFLVEDQAALARAQFLSDRGIVSFRVSTLSSYLSGA